VRVLRTIVDASCGPSSMTLVTTMQSSTSYNYSIWATSSFASHSSGLGILSIATSLIGAVANPCASAALPLCCSSISSLTRAPSLKVIAKLSDVSGRPPMYLISVVCYAIGFVMILKVRR
jgi:hypothetical protein